MSYQPADEPIAEPAPEEETIEDIAYDEDEELPHSLLDNLGVGNIVDQIKDEDHAGFYTEIIENYEIAQTSMTDWLKKYTNAINLAKLLPTKKGEPITEKSFPFQGASMAMLPYVMEAALDFSSRASPELVWAEKIVTTKVYGKEFEAGPGFDQEQVKEALDKTKEARADRVSLYMNYQLTEEIPNWRDGQDKVLMMLPIVGTAYKETYRDFDIKGIQSELVRADKLIFDMDCENFYDAEHLFKKIEVSRNDLISNIRGDQEWEVVEDDLDDKEKSFHFVKAYTYLDLDDDGVAEPYIAILDEDKQKIVYLYPRYEADTLVFNEKEELIKVEAVSCFTQYRFLPDPEGGPMGLGWGILLGPMFTAINNSLRQLTDAGTLQLTSSNSGLIAGGIGKGKANRQKAGPIKTIMGQLTPVAMGGLQGSLRDNIVQFPFAGPSATLFELLSYMVESARSMTNAAVNIEGHPGEAASLYLARLQQGLKIPNSIMMRVYEASKKEFQKISALNFNYHDEKAYNKVIDESPKKYSMKADFNPDDCDVRVAANPAQGSDIERTARSEAVLLRAESQATMGIQVIDVRQATIAWLESMGVQDIEKVAPERKDEGPSPEMQAEIAMKQAEMEMKKKDQELRQQGQQLQEKKMQMEAAKSMAEIEQKGTDQRLKADETVAKITGIYAKALKDIADTGLAQHDQALKDALHIEQTFIDSERGTTNARPTPRLPTPQRPSLPAPARNLAGGPGNQGPV